MNKTQPRIETLFKEVLRQTLHSAVALFILPLRWLGFEYALIFSVAAFFWNLLVMPRLFAETLRYEEKKQGFSRGMLVYPVTIFVLGLGFPLPVIASAWAVLSVSDGLATLAGLIFAGKPLPWNKNKSWIGFFAFFISATIFGLLAFIWTKVNLEGSSLNWFLCQSLSKFREISPALLFLYISLSSICASIVESLPISKIDDNITAPLAYATMLTALVYFSPS